LSVLCNTLHGTEYKITCGVRVCVCVCARAHWFRGPISRKRLEIEVRLQWDTNRERHVADRLDTWPMTSRDLGRSWPQYVWGPLSRKWLEIETWLQWSTYSKWHLGNQKVTWPWQVEVVTPCWAHYLKYDWRYTLSYTFMTLYDPELLGHADIFG